MGEQAAQTGIDATDERVELWGWGRRPRSAARVERYRASVDLSSSSSGAAECGTLARGLGRSYGDASLNAGGRVLDMTAHRGVRDFAVTSGRITVDAGLSLHDLMRAVLPFGWFVPVTPGTRFVTVGGCIACDIHGKNHHRDGGFADNVVSFMLLTPARGGVLVTARDEPTLFWRPPAGWG